MATSTLHEDLERHDEATGPSDRKFGLTIGIILALIGIVKSIERSPWGILCDLLAFALIGSALLRPSLLSALNWTWLQLGLALHRIVSPLIMAVLFFGTVLPIGLLMRRLGKDPLRRELDKAADSYWLPRSDPRPPSDAMRRQF